MDRGGRRKHGGSKKIPLLRYYRVFEIGSQVEGLERKRKGPFYHDPIGEAERVKGHYVNPPSSKK